MTVPENISADYTLRPSELAAVLALLVEARQPCILWGPPGSAKSMIAQQVAAAASRRYVDVRALLLDPVDLRGIPWRDGADRTRWAPPAFLPPSDDSGRWLINLEELPSAVPMVQAALYQLVLDRKVGEYELPEGASLIACGNRETDRGVVHRMPTPLASRFVHLEIRVDAEDWLAWGAANAIAAEVLFFITYEPDLLHQFDPPVEGACLRVSPGHGNSRATSSSTATGSLRRPRGRCSGAPSARPRRSNSRRSSRSGASCPHPRAIVNDPENADIPSNASALMALCGALYKLASDINFDAIVTYGDAAAARGGRVPGRRVRAPGARAPALARLHPLGRGQDPVKENAMVWRITHYPAGDAPLARLRGAGAEPRGGQAKARRRPQRPVVDPSIADKEQPMDLNRDAMLAGLRITAWSGRLYDREASDHRRRPPRRLGQRRALQQAPAAQGRLRRAHRDHERGPHQALARTACRGTTRAGAC